MAINFQQVLERIVEIGRGAGARQLELSSRREAVRQLLEAWADKPQELRDKVERVRQGGDPGLRCAIPLDGHLDASASPPAEKEPVTLLAADGSQILPDRHAALLFSLVNVGAIRFEPGSGKVPEIFTDSHLLYAGELYTPTGMLTVETIELQRDIAERRKLLDLASEISGPCVALTDGPVELWGAKNSSEGDYRKSLELHKSILSQLQARGVIVAGYVDKPGADLVVRTLEIAAFSEEQLKNVRELHPLRGVTDLWLFGSLLEAGHRSSVFGMQSGSRVHYTGDLALHFFYLNVGDAGYPSIVRVEIPKWVADDHSKLDLLHAVLLDQCRLMGVRPYPYILHRSHEIAVVSLDEKQQVSQMLELELRNAGEEVGQVSAKSSAKGLPGKGRI